MPGINIYVDESLHLHYKKVCPKCKNLWDSKNVSYIRIKLSNKTMSIIMYECNLVKVFPS